MKYPVPRGVIHFAFLIPSKDANKIMRNSVQVYFSIFEVGKSAFHTIYKVVCSCLLFFSPLTSPICDNGAVKLQTTTTP